MKHPDLVSRFVADAPWTPEPDDTVTSQTTGIAGVTVTPLIPRRDSRGALTEVLSLRDPSELPIVHVYQVLAEAGSVRGWVFHKRQSDRLAFTEGQFRLALYDLRQDSPTWRALEVLELGADAPCRVTIPAHVAHALKNTGADPAMFLNLPTAIYDPADPDKARLAYPEPQIPFEF